MGFNYVLDHRLVSWDLPYMTCARLGLSNRKASPKMAHMPTISESVAGLISISRRLKGRGGMMDIGTGTVFEDVGLKMSMYFMGGREQGDSCKSCGNESKKR